MTTFEEALQDPEPAVRLATASAVTAMGSAGRDLKRVLFRQAVVDRVPRVRYAMLRALDSVAPTREESVPILLELLSGLPKDEPDDPVGFARSLAAWGLGRIGPPAGEVAVPLLAAIAGDRDDHADPRYASGWSLVKLASVAQEAVPPLREIVASDPDSSMRSISAEALGAIGRPSEAAVSVLITALADESPLVREDAARALGRIGADPQRVVPALISALNDPDPIVREFSVESLGKFGAEAAAAVSAVVETLRTDTPLVRRKAALALGAIGPQARAAIAALTTRAARDHSEYVRAAARCALEEIEPGSAKRLPGFVDREQLARLRQRLASDDGYERAEATWHLATWGPAVVEFVPRLIQQLAEDPHSDARWAACWALGRIRSSAPEVVHALTRAVRKEPDPDNRAEAVRSLGWLGPGASAAVPALVDALDDPYTLIREESATALGRIGRADDAVPALERALGDIHEPVRPLAREALAAIRRESPAPPA